MFPGFPFKSAFHPRVSWAVCCSQPSRSHRARSPARSPTRQARSCPASRSKPASPALIEGARTTVTDDQGRYQITGLRPGAYKVTFSLPGFRTIIREGIELTAGFTATVSPQMAVGAVEETITVAGATPVVDVQSVTTQTVMTRDVLDAVPTGRNIQAIGILIPGTGLQVGGGAAYSVDVGGSGGMQQSPLAFHGNTNSVQQVDGIRYNNMEGAGQYSGMYWNDGMIQEIQYTTSGDSAETQAGGVRINMIPKEGGNTFRGTVFGNFTYDKWHSNNLDQRLIDRGLQSVGKIQEIWDFNPSIGGPILRDRLWFHYSMRNWGVNRTVPGSFSEIDLDRPSIDDSYINSNVLRMTWQINNTHKLGAHYDRNHKYRGHWGLASNVSEEAAAIEDMPQSYNASVKWTATLTNQLLAQAGLGLYTQQYREIYREELPTAPGTLSAFPNGARYDPFYANFDVGTNLYRGAFRGRNVFHISGVKNWAGSLSYVTGSNTLKGGVQLQQGISREHDQHRGDMEVRFLNGAPSQVLLYATPRNAVEEITDLGLFIDEKWSLGRFTISGGLRYDYFNGTAPDQWSPPATWVPARLTPAIENIPNWTRHQSAARRGVGPVRQRADGIEIHDRPVRRSGGRGADPDAESDAPDLVQPTRGAGPTTPTAIACPTRTSSGRPATRDSARWSRACGTTRPTSRASRRGRATGTITCRSSTSCGRGWGSRAPTISSSCSTRCCRRRAAPRSSAAGRTTCAGVPGTSTSSRSWCPTIHGCLRRSANTTDQRPVRDQGLPAARTSTTTGRLRKTTGTTRKLTRASTST